MNASFLGEMKKKTLWKYILVSAVFLYLQQFQLSFSLCNGAALFKMSLKWVLLNIVIVSVPFLTVFLIVRRLDIATILSAVTITILSIINHHVLVYHGSPFFAADIFSIRTALNVMGGYMLIINRWVVCTCIIGGIEFLFWFFLRMQCDWFRQKCQRNVIGLPLIVNIVCIYFFLFSPFTLFPANIITWDFGTGTVQYGYSVCLCNSAYSLFHFVTIPDGYCVEDVTAESSVEGNGGSPDFIVILNESLCDIDQYTPVPESKELFERMNHIPGVINGFSVCPSIGGGTNNSEYELLTSNSMNILEISAPFTVMSMDDTNNVASYLKQLGYTSVGMHCRKPSNYSRNRAYTELGFDKVVLGDDAFRYHGKNGNRDCLDSDNYLDLIEQYESCDESPRFLYLLTYQNHGGYEKNDDVLDTIHVQGNKFGSRTDDVNEYLSSIELSVSAFEELTSYFREQDRPVVILMVGDHVPPFLAELLPLKGTSTEEQEIALRTVPFYIWSNIPLNESVIAERSSMVDLVPMILKASGMPISMYYQTILKLNQALPIRTGKGYYSDASGNVGVIQPGTEYYELLQNYYYMEYNNIHKGADYVASWFQPGNP